MPYGLIDIGALCLSSTDIVSKEKEVLFSVGFSGELRVGLVFVSTALPDPVDWQNTVYSVLLLCYR